MVVALLLTLLTAASAAGEEPTRDITLGTYKLHVSLEYQAQAANNVPMGTTTPAANATSAYWKFSTQSESAKVSASWNDQLKLTETAEGSHDFSVLPVNFTHAEGYLHDVEYHSLGSPGINTSVSDSYTGTYYSPEEQTCQETCPPTTYKATPFSCSANYSNAQLDPDLVVLWEEKTNLAKFEQHGYLNPLRPGAVMLGASFLLGSRLADQAKTPETGESPGEVSPSCPPDVNIFVPWSASEALLSSEYAEQTGPASRAVYFPLDTLIDKGRASSTFTGPAVSPTKCCSGTTKMTLTIIAVKLH